MQETSMRQKKDFGPIVNAHKLGLSDLSTWRNPYLTQFFPQAMADAQNSMP